MVIKIAFIISNLDGDGGQTVVCTVLENLDKSKYLPKLYILSEKVENKLTKQLRKAKVDFEFLNEKCPYRYIRIIEIIYRLDQAMKYFQPDVIHVHLDTLYSWIWALLRKRRILFTVHSEANRISGKLTLKLFEKMNRRNLIKVIGVSEFATAKFKEVFTAKEVETIYNPVDNGQYHKCTKMQHDGVHFINVARFNPIKNHKLLIDAFAMVCKQMENVKLYLVGDGQEYENMKEYVCRKRIADKVIFTGYKENVAELLAQADVFVLSSLSEAFPVSVIEALAAGLPIVATRVGGLPELVSDNGILVETNHVKQLSHAMLELGKDEKKRRLMGNSSLEKSKQFDTSKILEQYGRLYDEEAKRKKEIYYYN